MLEHSKLFSSPFSPAQHNWWERGVFQHVAHILGTGIYFFKGVNEGNYNNWGEENDLWIVWNCMDFFADFYFSKIRSLGHSKVRFQGKNKKIWQTTVYCFAWVFNPLHSKTFTVWGLPVRDCHSHPRPRLQSRAWLWARSPGHPHGPWPPPQPWGPGPRPPCRWLSWSWGCRSQGPELAVRRAPLAEAWTWRGRRWGLGRRPRLQAVWRSCWGESSPWCRDAALKLEIGKIISKNQKQKVACMMTTTRLLINLISGWIMLLEIEEHSKRINRIRWLIHEGLMLVQSTLGFANSLRQGRGR